MRPLAPRLSYPVVTTLARRVAIALAGVLLLPAASFAAQWMDVATISSTLTNTPYRLCIGGGRTDLGCPADAPLLDRASGLLTVPGDLRVIGNLYVSGSQTFDGVQFANGGVSATGTISATNFSGNGSGLTGVVASSADWYTLTRIPAQVQAVSNGTAISMAGISSTNVSVTNNLTVGGALTAASAGFGPLAATSISATTGRIANDFYVGGNFYVSGSQSIDGVSFANGGVSATGTVTATSFSGNGSGITGIDFSANPIDRIISGSYGVYVSNTGFITANNNISVTGNVSVTNNLTANTVTVSTGVVLTNLYYPSLFGLYSGTPSAPTLRGYISGANFVWNSSFQAGNFGAGNGSASFPTYAFSNDSTSGMYRPAGSYTIAFATNGTERMRITSTGLVGINTTNPTANLEVSGTISGTIINGKFIGDGSGLTGVTAASADRIISGTAQMIANGNSNSISITEAGVTTGYYYNGIWVAGGVSTTGAISATSLYGGLLNVTGQTALTNVSATGNVSVTGNVSANRFIGDGSLLTNISTSAINISINDLTDASASLVKNSVFLGNGSGNLSTGTNNTAVGVGAMSSNTTGANNTAHGYKALYYNTTGNANVANGYGALYSNTVGINNTANGASALQNNTTGGNNVANGTSALQSNVTGGDNVANGSSALFSNINGSSNIANGSSAMYSNINGGSNVANGAQALYTNASGSNNVAIGSLALYYPNPVTGTVAIGYNAGQGNGSTGYSYGTYVGTASGYSVTSGNNNTFYGAYSGDSVTTGSRNIVIGYDADTPAPAVSDWLNIGNAISGTNTAGGSMTFVGGIKAQGVVTATYFEGDGSRLTGVIAASSDRITSGTAAMIANGNTNSISITESGVTTGYYYNGIWVAGGVSTTGAISGTRLYGGLLNVTGQSTLANVSATNASLTGNLGAGMANPPERLGVSGSIMLTQNNSLNGNMYWDGSTWRTYNSGYGQSIAFNSTLGKMFFNTTASSTGANAATTALIRMTLDANGSLGIGTIYPSTTLDVSGTLKLANGGEACDTNRTGAIRYAGGHFQVCYGSGGWATLTDASSTVATADRITSGTAQVIANGTTNSISITESGITTGYYYNGIWVAGGISTTGAGKFNNVSVTTDTDIGGNLTVGGHTVTANVSTTGNVSVTGNVSANKFIGDGSLLTNISASAINGLVTDRITSGTSSAYIGPNGNVTVNGRLDIVTGSEVVAVGLDAGANNRAYASTLFGYAAGQNNDHGADYLTAIGHNAATDNSGTQVTALGDSAGQFNTGNMVTALGIDAAKGNTGTSSVFVGHGTGSQNTGGDVTAVGNGAAKQNSGQYLTALGEGAGFTNTYSNATLLGNGVQSADKDNQVVLGNADVVEVSTSGIYAGKGVSVSTISASYVDATRNGTVSATNGYFTNISATHFYGDGSGLTGVIAAGSDRITSGTAQMIANGNTNSISITEGGITTGYYYNGIWVAGGVSTTGPISGTTGYFSGNVGLGVAPSATTRLVVNGNLSFVTASTISTPGPELVFEQRGDVYGTSRLRLQNRNGANGAMFESPDLDLVDFAFMPSSGAQKNIRYEHRPGSLALPANQGGEFEFIDPLASPTGFKWFVTGPSATMFATPVSITDNVSITGNVSANKFIGDGSALTGIATNLSETIAINDLLDASASTVAGSVFLGDGAGSVAEGTYNTGVGIGAMNAMTSGGLNVAVGYRSLFKETIGQLNTALGYQALTKANDTTGNTAVGALALAATTSGTNNTAVGYLAMNKNTLGTENTSIGHGALYANTTGVSNFAAGSSAMSNGKTSSYNTATGANALLSNVDGNNNVANGANALTYAKPVTNTVAIGANAALGVIATTAFENGTFLGYASGQAITTGSNNTFLGAYSGLTVTTGANNIIIGYNTDAPTPSTSNYLNIGGAIQGDLSGDMTFIGGIKANGVVTATYFEGDGSRLTNISASAISGLTTDRITSDTTTLLVRGDTGSISFTTPDGTALQWDGVNSSFFVGYNNGSHEVASYGFGQHALENGTGQENFAAGRYALSGNTGNFNLALGSNILADNTGNHNLAIGDGAMNSGPNTGNDNVAIGQTALAMITTGNNNIALGNSAFANLNSGSNNIGIGFVVDPPSPTISDWLNIGNAISGTMVSNSTGLSFIGGIKANGIVTATYFEGDGSRLTNLPSTTINLSETMAINDLSDAISDGSSSLYMGNGAGVNSLGANANTAVGINALNSNSSGNNNTALGAGALYNSASNRNTAVGSNALYYNTASYNTAVGYNALYFNNTGTNNIAMGGNAIANNQTGSNNVAIGQTSLYNANPVTNTVALGYQSGFGSGGSTAFQNGTFLGSYSGLAITTGNDNTFLGYYAGATTTTGSSNTLIGALAYTPTPGTSNFLNIANVISGSMVQGGSLTFIGGIKANGVVTATYFEGDGSRLTNISASAISGLTSDRITSGTSAVTVNSATNIISITNAGVNTGYFDGLGRLVTPGISTTGVISTTGFYSASGASIGSATTTTGLLVVANRSSNQVASLYNTNSGGWAGIDYFNNSGNQMTLGFGGSSTSDNNRGFVSMGNSTYDFNFYVRRLGILGTGNRTTPSATLHVMGTAYITSWTGINLGVAPYVTPTAPLEVSGTVSATNFVGKFVGDGSGLTGVTAAGSDRIISGTAQVIANSSSNSISITEAGVTTGYYYNGIWVAGGVSTTGPISTTNLYVSSTSSFTGVLSLTSQFSQMVGTNNVQLGRYTGTGGNQVTNVGIYAGQLDTGNNTVNIGYTAGGSASGNSSVYIGSSTGQYSSGAASAGLGSGALQYNTSANTVGYGNNSLQYNSGVSNTAIGSYAMQFKAAGTDNTALGFGAGQGVSNSTAYSRNTLVGSMVGNVLTTGSSNTVIGARSAMGLTTGSSNIIIGAGLDPYANTGSYQLNIGNAVWGNIGSGSGNANLIGINVTSPTANLEVSGTVSATRFVGDGSSLTGIATGNPDRITSGTTSVIAISSTSYISLTTAGTTWGYFSSLASYLPALTANTVSSTRVSATNVSATLLQLNSVAGSAGVSLSVSGDNLGNHTATQALNMATFAITGAGSISASGNIQTSAAMQLGNTDTTCSTSADYGKMRFDVSSKKLYLCRP